MPRPPLRLGKLGALLLALLIAGLVFIGGSTLFDFLFLREPSEAQITAGIRAEVPEKYRRFSIARTDPALTSPKSGEIKIQRVSLVPNSALYKAANFEEEAIMRGDDPVLFADAVARHKKLDLRSSPPLPTEQPLKNLYDVATFSQADFVVDVSYGTRKTERNWSLRDCWAIWHGSRDWSFPHVEWPDIPKAVAILHQRHDLGLNPVILGEKSTEASFRSYIERRKAFIKAVQERENRSIDQLIHESVRQWVEQSFKPKEAYVVKTVTPARKPAQTGTIATGVFEASIVIEQQAELFRPDKVDALRSEIAPLHERLEQAKKLVVEFVTGSTLSVPVLSAVYRSESPVGTSWTGNVTFEIKTSSSVSVENIRWTQDPKWPTGPIVSYRESEPNAVFYSTDTKLRTVARYQEELEAYMNEAAARRRDAGVVRRDDTKGESRRGDRMSGCITGGDVLP